MVNKYEEEMVRLNKGKENVIKRIFDCYREMYKESRPSVDFDTLCESGIATDDYFFDVYYISPEKFKEIHAKHGKHLRKHDRVLYDFEVYLGCSPTTNSFLKKEEEENKEGVK